MTTKMIFFVLVFTSLLGLSESATALNLTPKRLEPGITETFIVNCTFSFDTPSNISSLISLIISQADTNKTSSSTTFHDIVSVNTFSQGHVTELSHPNATISSQIAGGDNSYLTLTWAYPSEAEAGIYRCEANGMDSTGHPLFESVDAEVKLVEIDNQNLLSEIRNLRSEYGNLKSRFEKLELLLNKTVTELNTIVTPNLSDLLRSFEVVENYTELTVRKTSFKSSDSYRNRTYYISKETFHAFQVAQLSCQVIGGYLVEINDLDELEFVKKYIDEESYSYYAVGITNKGNKGKWVYLFSNEPVPSVVYAGDPPNYPDYDCVCIVHSELEGCSCKTWYYSVCEVPDY